MPFKGLAAPKRRLAPLLSLAERRGLARAMLSDVLAALGRAEGFGRMFVISPDPAALELPAEVDPQALITLGYGALEPPVRERRPLEELVLLDT